MSAKAEVLKVYPKAYAYKWGGPVPWVIYSGDEIRGSLNSGDKTAAQAWAAALVTIKEKP